MKWLSTADQYPIHDAWVLVKANVNGADKYIMAHYECVVYDNKTSHEFKDYREQKLFHCKCHPIEWAYIQDDVVTHGPTDTPFTKDQFGIRAYNVLIKNGIDTLEKLCEQTPMGLLSLRGMGIISLDAICDELDFLNLTLKEDNEG